MDKFLIGAGVWLFGDGLFSLLIWTRPGCGQSWWRDHSIRVVRMLLGGVLVVLGVLGK